MFFCPHVYMSQGVKIHLTGVLLFINWLQMQSQELMGEYTFRRNPVLAGGV